MPPIFKKLVSISVWILFVTGCLGIISNFIGRGILGGGGLWTYAPLTVMLSVVAVWFRKKLED